MAAKLTYSKAYSELEQILSDMQSDDVPIDQLSVKVKRSKELLEFCKKNLRQSQKEIDDLVGK